MMTWRAALLWYLATALVVCFLRLGSTAAIHNEGIVADGVRHMARTGQLLVPHLYNEPYTYKPPLTHWLVLTSFELTGRESTWALRAPIGLMALLLGLAVLNGVGRAGTPRLGLMAALATLTTGLGLEKMRIAESDLPLAAGVGVAVVLASVNLATERPRSVNWALCYAALTVGFLAKGTPAAMVFFPGLVAAAWLTGRLRDLVSWRHLIGLSLFALTFGLYLWLSAGSGHPGLFDQPLAEAHARGVQWDARALAMTLFKPLAAFVAFLPWSGFLPAAVLGLRDTAPRRATTRLLRLSLGFLLGGMLAFLVVPSFEVRYFLPLAAPVGIVAGIVAGAPARRSLARWAIAVALGMWLVYVFELVPRRAEKRGFERAANELASLVPEASWLWIPDNPTNEESLLVFHLDRPAIRLRPGHSEPLPGSLALLTPEQLVEIEPGPALAWTELGRGGNAHREYVLCRLELTGCPPNPALYEQRIVDLYSALLARAPTVAETASWVQRLKVGTPLVEAAREVLAGPEFAERRRGASDDDLALQVVRGILDREPIPGGLATVVGPLRQRQLHRRVADMMRRDEYLARRPYCRVSGPDPVDTSSGDR